MFNTLKTQSGQRVQSLWLATGLNEYWARLSANDQRAVKMLMAVLVLAGSYFLLWQPIQTEHQKALSQLQSAKQDWQWLNSQLPKLAKQTPQSATFAKGSQSQLTQSLQQTLRKLNLAQQVSEIQPVQVGGKPGVQVRFDSVMAPRFLRWLTELEQAGLVAQKLTIKPIEAGLVNATVQFN